MPDLFGNEKPKRKPAGAEILVDIPAGFESEDEDADEVDLEDLFTDLIKDRDGELHGPMLAALDLDLDDDRAVVDDIEIELVEASGDDIHVSYIVSLSAYHGCSDANYADDDHRMISGTRRGSQWVFDRHVSPERLAPNEEL